jgi:hypothetical protein
MAKRRNKQPDTTETMTGQPASPPDIIAASAETTTPADAGTPPTNEAAAEHVLAICPQIADAPSIAPPGDDVLKAEIAKVMAASEDSVPAVEKIFPIIRAEKLIDAHIIDEKVIDEKVIDEKVVNLQAPRRAGFKRLRARHAMRLAASIAIAAAVGAMAGALSTLALQSSAAPVNDTRVSGADIARLEQELAALKSGTETSRKTAGAQLAKLTERLDRAERTQSEPAAKLAKLTETVDRLERRSATSFTTAASLGTTSLGTTSLGTPPSIGAPSTLPAAGDITGSIPTPSPRSLPQGEARQLQPPQTEASAPPKPPVVEGWTLRNVYDGVALVQGRFGLIEVEPGDVIPGVGRIDNIRRQDGRWVVVTSKGLIVAR